MATKDLSPGLLYHLRYPAFFSAVVLSLLSALDKAPHMQQVWAWSPFWIYLAFAGTCWLAIQALNEWLKAIEPTLEPYDEVELTADEIVGAGLTDYFVANSTDEELDEFINQLEAAQ